VRRSKRALDANVIGARCRVAALLRAATADAPALTSVASGAMVRARDSSCTLPEPMIRLRLDGERRRRMAGSATP
jgi:hypothetical protein